MTEVNGTPITSGGPITLPSGATLVMNSDGSFTYDDNGATALGSPDSFTYTIDDGNGGTDTATVAVTVNPPAFVCSDGTAFLFQNDPTDVFTVDLITGAANEVASDITPGSLTINGIGFNQTDGYIWGSVQTSSGRIARIGADYVPQYFDIPGLPRDYNVGDVSADGLLHLYVAGVGVTSTAIYVVDVDPASPTYLTLLSTLPGTNPPAARVFDFAISPIDGNIYGVSDKTNSTNAKLHRFDPTTGARSEVGEITGADINATNGLFGAVYFFRRRRSVC